MARTRSNHVKPTISMLNLRDWSPQLVALGLFLLLLLVTGGSSRYDVPQLVALRPIAICLVGFGLATMTRQAWLNYRGVFLLFGAIVLLTASHLVPLPSDVWRALPGRQIIAEIDQLAGLGSIWRPMSMFPEGTWNALYSLSVPVGVLLLAVQLNQEDHIRLLICLLVACFVTGFVGVLQASGSNFDLYGSGESGVAGVFANRNHQAALLASTFPMLGALALCAPKISMHDRAIRLIALAGALTLIPLILVTGSRMGVVVALFAFAYTLILSAGRMSGSPVSARTTLLRLLTAVIVGAGALFATMYAARDVAFQRIGGEGEDLRWLIWQTTVDFIPQYLPWGTGIGSFVPVYQIHEPSEMLMPVYINQAHNDWLDLVLTAGLPGVLIALVALIMFARATGAALVTQGVIGSLRRTGVGIIFVLAFASLSDYPARTPLVSALIAIAAVWAFAPSAKRKIAES